MRTRESFLTLIAELEGDFGEYTRLMSLNRRAWDRIAAGANDVLDWGALGFTLHAAYGALENYFLRISKFFENSLSSEHWHRELVEKMALDIPAVRPAFLGTTKVKGQVLELLKFRHRFRNLYGEDLDPARTSEVQKTAVELAGALSRLHAEFIGKLAEIAEALS